MLLASLYSTMLATLSEFLIPGDTSVFAANTRIIFRSTTPTAVGGFAGTLNGLFLFAGMFLLKPLILLTPGMAWIHRYDTLIGAFVLTLMTNPGFLAVYGWASVGIYLAEAHLFWRIWRRISFSYTYPYQRLLLAHGLGSSGYRKFFIPEA